MKALFVLLSLVISATTFAGHPNKEPGSDGSSGCGLGWEVSKKKSLVSSWVRAMTNSTASQSIAMTMGTSGCEKHEIAMQEKLQEHFANSNYKHVLADMASGQGQYLNEFSSIVGCDASALGAYSQSNFGSVVASSGATFLRNVKTAISTNADLKASCTL